MHGDIGYKFYWLLSQSKSTSWTWINWDTNWDTNQSAFRAIAYFRFDIQSHVSLNLVFRATSSLSVQIHFFIWCPESLHHPFRHLVSCFVSFWRSEPSSHLRSAFRAIIVFSAWCSESSSSLPSLTFLVACPVLAFRAIIASSFGVQSHVLLYSAFRAISSFGIRIHFFIRCSEPLHIVCFDV